jgi:hypothetical protein
MSGSWFDRHFWALIAVAVAAIAVVNGTIGVMMVTTLGP